MSDQWRYRCPRNHCTWTSLSDGYKCKRCNENGDDPYFDDLVDAKRASV